jgi:hypothetical protein
VETPAREAADSDAGDSGGGELWRLPLGPESEGSCTV